MRARCQKANSVNRPSLLRTSRERPRRRADEQGDEAAPSQFTKFHHVAAIWKARSIPKGDDQVRTCAVQDFGRPAVRCGSFAPLLMAFRYAVYCINC
jgi:hypothetical protein